MKEMTYRKIFSLLVLCFTVLGACQQPSTTPLREEKKPLASVSITVGSKSMTEQYLLMKMTALLLKEQGATVNERRFLDSDSIRKASLAGYVDMYWEYTSTARIVHQNQEPVYNEKKLYQLVKETDEKKHLTWLHSSQFNSSWGVLVNRSFAKEHHLNSVSDLISYIKKQNKKVKIATNNEFLKRKDGLMQLANNYELKSLSTEIIGIDSEIIPLAVKEGRVDVGIGMISDSRIQAYDLVLLKEDQSLFPPYYAAPVVKQSLASRYPSIVSTLNELSSKLTNKKMVELNYQVDILHKDVSDVAYKFLLENDLLTP